MSRYTQIRREISILEIREHQLRKSNPLNIEDRLVLEGVIHGLRRALELLGAPDERY